MSGSAISFGDDRFHLDATVESVALSPDGTLLAAAGTSSTVVWELATARVVARTGRPAYAVAFTDNATLWLAMARLYRWRFREASAPAQVSRNESPLAVSRDGALLAAADRGNVAILSSADGQVRRVRKGRGRVRSLAFSDDGAHLAIGSDKKAIVLEVASGREVKVAVPAAGRSVHVAFARPDRLLIARDVTKVVQVVALDGAPGTTLELVDYFSDFALSPDGSRFVVASDGGLQTFDASSLAEIQRVLDKRPWKAPVFAGLGRVAAGALRAVHFVDVEAGHIEQPPAAQQDGASVIACSPDGSFVATAGGDDTVTRLWHPEDGGLVAAFPCAHRVEALAVSPDGRTLAVGTWRSLRLFDVATGSGCVVESEFCEVAAVAFAPDGRLATASESGRVVLRDPAGGAETEVIRTAPRFAGATGRPGLAFSADGRWIALAPAAGGLIVFDAATGDEVLSRRGKSPRAAAVSFASDAARLCYADADALVVIDMPHGNLVRRHTVGMDAHFALLAANLLVVSQPRAPLVVVDVETGHSRALETERSLCAISRATGDRVLVGYEDGTAALVPLAPSAESLDAVSPYRAAAVRAAPLGLERPAAASDDEVKRAARGLFVVRRRGRRLSLDVHWPRYRIRGHLLMGVIYALPAGFLLSPNPPIGLALLLGVPMACAALYRFYLALACGVNHSRLEIDSVELRVDLGPLPWWGSRRLPVRSVDQLYVKELTVRYSSRGGRYEERSYDLRAQLADGRDVKVLSAALEPDLAKALEATLQAHLGVQNRSVEGEYEGDARR